MPMRSLSLAIVGANHPNKRGPTRRFGIALCRPGDQIELRREPKNPADEYAIAVFVPQGIQIGYVTSQRAAFIAPMLDRGRVVEAVFQQPTMYGCVIRAAFDGEHPTLPPATDRSEVDLNDDGDTGFWPDQEWPDE